MMTTILDDLTENWKCVRFLVELCCLVAFADWSLDHNSCSINYVACFDDCYPCSQRSLLFL
jgi:hypothetical protein